jgi:hypothetical protein
MGSGTRCCKGRQEKSRVEKACVEEGVAATNSVVEKEVDNDSESLPGSEIDTIDKACMVMRTSILGYVEEDHTIYC